MEREAVLEDRVVKEASAKIALQGQETSVKIVSQKKEVRAKVSAHLKTVSKEWVEQQSRMIQDLIISSPEYQSAGTIFTYVNFGKEVVTIPVIEDAFRSGKRVGVPLCIGPGIMEVREITSVDGLVPGAYGILEPAADTPVMSSSEIEFGIIPCVTCNRSGARMGHGAGYYDRYLEDCSWIKAILCFDEIMEDEIPVDEHDVKMDLVVSQSGIVRL